MSYPARLKSLLASGPVIDDRARDASDLCFDWFKHEASLASFVFRSVFRDLITRGWGAS